jgi:Pyruvate/2-oxoacid:ferredoxin oxidoreductase gamma subunit
MNGTDIQISICGSAGDGTIAAGEILRNVMAEIGYRVICFDVYPSEIRGFGKCIARLRISTQQTYSLKEQSDVLVSLNDSHAIAHVGEVREYGAVIYERSSIVDIPEGGHMSAHLAPGHLPYPLSMRDLSEKATGANRSRNIVALGFLAGLFGLPAEAFQRAIVAKFKRKAAAAEANVKAMQAGYDAGAGTFKLDDVRFGPPVATVVPGATVSMINGNAAVVRGCLDAGIANYFGYPITPATSIMERLATEMPKHGARLLQTEDEIAAISGTIGAGEARCPSAADRGRDCGDLGHHWRRIRRRPRRHRHLGAGSGADVGDDRPGRHRRGAGGGLRVAARRAVHRHADQDRAVGPQHRGLWRPWRRTAHRHRADQRRRLLPLCRQGVRDGGGVPDAGHRPARPVSFQPL